MVKCYIFCVCVCLLVSNVVCQFGLLNYPQENRYENYDMYYQPRYYDQYQQYQNGQENRGRQFIPGTIRKIINQFSNRHQDQETPPNYLQPPNYGNNVPSFENRFSDVNTHKIIDLSNPSNSNNNEKRLFPPHREEYKPKIIQPIDGEGTFIFPDEDNNRREDIILTEEPKIVEQTTIPPIPIEVETTTQNGLVHITPNFEARSVFDSSFFKPTCNNTVNAGLGTCVNIKKCEPIVKLLQQRNNPQVVQLLRESQCGFEGNYPKVCCPLPGIPNNPPTAAPTEPPTQAPVKMPDDSRPKDATNGTFVELPEPPVCGVSGAKFTRVVNGVPANLGDFPWMALLGYRGRRDPNSPRWLCGGSLISSRHVLTAAHCIHNHESDLYQVRLGELDLARDDDGATPIDVPIISATKHEEYSPTKFTNDIGILTLGVTVTFTDLIKPICMPTKPELRSKTFERYTPFIAGWGDTEFHGPSATHLQVVQLPVVTNEKCARAYSSYKAQVIDNRVLCAGFERGGKDACQGDSGGPLMQPIPGNSEFFFYQTGVVSFGKKCAEAGFPGVYSRVTYFIPWITEKVTGFAI